jgi:signal transduction histidine kinase/ligand-binding sensor domain-containing protein/CheY-like chemotaxis protein/AraC-like DNA-binding protein
VVTDYFAVHAQPSENDFDKVRIELDGEEVYTVGEIAQDKQGYIWLSTNLGLIRYDGLEGKLYDAEKSEASGDYIETLFVDHLGELWIGANSGVSKYSSDCDCLIQYPSLIDDFPMTLVRSITEDKNKNIWIGTRHGSLFRYERESESFIRFLHGNSDSLTSSFEGIYHLLVDQHNNIWIGTDSGLVRYNISIGNIKQFSHDPSDPNTLSDDRISALYEDKLGQLLVGTFRSGFHIFDPKTELLKRISFDTKNPNQIHAPYSKDKVYGGDPRVHIIYQDQNGGYWIGTTGKGVNYFNSGTKTFKHYDFNLVNPEILSSLLEDKQGNIWIGGLMGAGLFKTDLFKLKYHVYTNFPNVGRAYESTLNPGILWICSQQYGLRKMNLKTNEVVSYLNDTNNSKSIGHTWVRSLYQENKNTLWAGLGNGGAYGGFDGNGGISRMDIETGQFTNFKLLRDDDGLDDFSYTVFSIAEDYEGYLWLGAGPGGIFRSDKEKKEFKAFKNFKYGNPSDDVFLNISRVDSKGDVWASDFAGEGTLYLYDHKENTFNTYLEGFKMYNLLIDEKGWLLISTWEKGLIHLNPADKTYIQYTKKNGLPSNEALDIARGEKGIYWVNTRFGPAKFNAATSKITPYDVPNYRYNSGIFKASDGQIYFGSNSGLLSFNSSQVTGNPFPPQLNISDLMISNTNFLAKNIDSTELKFSHNQNDIAIRYVGLHYSNPEKNLYKYKLEPLDYKWVSAGHEKSVRFANLAPGSYSFQVTASNSDGVWSDEIASVQFTIRSPWWATWWAYALYIASIAFITYRVYHFQLSKKIAISESIRLKEVNQFKNNLFTNITHEFRTPLTVIKGMTDAISSKLRSKQDRDLENSLEMIERNSEGLLHLVNEMLDLAKLESGKMELQLVQSDVMPFLKYVSESFSSLAEENKISLTIYSEIDSLVMDFDASKLTSIISNLLSNAIKFTPELGKIIVHINQVRQNEKNYLFIKVKDNGIGIAEGELQNIFSRFYQTDASTVRESEGTGIGLALTKELVELMNGTIKAKSSLDKGSEFSVLIPVTRKAPVTKQVQMGNVSHPLVTKPVRKPEQSLELNSELPLVLIIEDNLDVAHYLKTCLKNKYETIHAINGTDGIEMALERIPDIIISDVMMPGKDGFEVCEALKSDERTDHIPIIILTAKASVEDRIKGLSHGADAYLAKPFNKEELFTRLDQLVSIRKKLVGKIQKEGFNTLLKKRTKNPKLQFLKKVIKLIHKEIGDSSFGSEELAKKLLISESQIYRKIKAITGKSTAVYIRSIRLQYAKDLLINTDKTISEVAYDVGFNDPSWFSRAFKDEFGISPSAANK